MEYRPKTLVFIRHAESVWNKMAPKRRGNLKEAPSELKGVPDHLTPLSPEGEEQARITGKKLAEIYGEFDTVYHSPWLRTTQTTNLILDQFPEEAAKRMRARCFRNLFLMEQNFGDLDFGFGDPKDIDEGYKKFYKKREKAGKFYLRTPNGESWADVCMRTHRFLDTIFRANRHNQRLLMILHGVSKQSFRYHLERLDEEQLVQAYEGNKVKNCGVSEYEWDESLNRYRLKFWNETYYPDPTGTE